MNVMYLDDGDSIWFGILSIEEHFIFFKAKDKFISLRDAKVRSFGGADDDFGITVAGFQNLGTADDKFQYRVITFYPDVQKMWDVKCRKMNIDPRKVASLPA